MFLKLGNTCSSRDSYPTQHAAGKISAPLHSLPDVHHPLNKLLKGMFRVTGDNFISALFMLSKSECMHAMLRLAEIGTAFIDLCRLDVLQC